MSNNTTEFRNNSDERKPKQESKQNNNNNNTREELKMVKGKKDIQIVKIQAGAEILVKEKQITKGLQNKMQKIIRMKNTLQLRNQEIHTATKKISTNLGNSTLLQNNNKKKST